MKKNTYQVSCGVCLGALILCRLPRRGQPAVSGSIDVRHGQRVRHGCFGSRNRRCPGHTDEPRHIGKKRTQSTGNEGFYSFVNLNPGRYKIDVEKPGFKRITRPEVVVDVQQTVRIDLAMQVGDVSQSIEVTGETPLLQPETSSLGQVVEERKSK